MMGYSKKISNLQAKYGAENLFDRWGFLISQANHLSQALVIIRLSLRQGHILFRIKKTGFFLGCHVFPPFENRIAQRA